MSWIGEGDPLEPGHVHVAQGRRVEILPDRTCAVSKDRFRAVDLVLDELLRSPADSLGARTLAVMLTGMGRDGARGALAVKRAGGTVIVQRADALLQLPAIAVVRADHTTSGVICYTRGGVRPVISAPEAGSGPDWHPLRGLASHAAPLRPHPTPRHASTPNGRYPNA